jgi:hypothetical protein
MTEKDELELLPSYLCGRHEHCIICEQIPDPPQVYILAEVVKKKTSAIGKEYPRDCNLVFTSGRVEIPVQFPSSQVFNVLFEGFKGDGHNLFRLFLGVDARG